MRIVIVHDTEDNDICLSSYLGKTAIIEDWFVEKSNLPSKCKEAVLLRTTEKAMLLKCKDTEFWVPRSLITFVDRKEKSLEDYENRKTTRRNGL